MRVLPTSLEEELVATERLRFGGKKCWDHYEECRWVGDLQDSLSYESSYYANECSELKIGLELKKCKFLEKDLN